MAAVRGSLLSEYDDGDPLGQDQGGYGGYEGDPRAGGPCGGVEAGGDEARKGRRDRAWRVPGDYGLLCLPPRTLAEPSDEQSAGAFEP